MNKSLVLAIILLMFGLSGAVNAEDKGKHAGPERSSEHQSEQGDEHGKAWAGSKEKKSKGSDEEDDMKKEKKAKKSKKEK